MSACVWLICQLLLPTATAAFWLNTEQGFRVLWFVSGTATLIWRCDTNQTDSPLCSSGPKTFWDWCMNLYINVWNDTDWYRLIQQYHSEKSMDFWHVFHLQWPLWCLWSGVLQSDARSQAAANKELNPNSFAKHRMGLLKHVTSHGQLDGEDDKPLEFGVPYETKKNHLAATHCTNSSNLVGQIPGLVVSQVLCKWPSMVYDSLCVGLKWVVPSWLQTAHVLGLLSFMGCKEKIQPPRSDPNVSLLLFHCKSLWTKHWSIRFHQIPLTYTNMQCIGLCCSTMFYCINGRIAQRWRCQIPLEIIKRTKAAKEATAIALSDCWFWTHCPALSSGLLGWMPQRSLSKLDNRLQLSQLLENANDGSDFVSPNHRHNPKAQTNVSTSLILFWRHDIVQSLVLVKQSWYIILEAVLCQGHYGILWTLCKQSPTKLPKKAKECVVMIPLACKLFLLVDVSVPTNLATGQSCVKLGVIVKPRVQTVPVDPTESSCFQCLPSTPAWRNQYISSVSSPVKPSKTK